MEEWPLGGRHRRLGCGTFIQFARPRKTLDDAHYLGQDKLLQNNMIQVAKKIRDICTCVEFACVSAFHVLHVFCVVAPRHGSV